MHGIIDDIGASWRQYKHPVFDRLGRQIGSYETFDKFCRGEWLLFQGEKQPPYSELLVIDFWGRRVPATQLCLDRNLRTTIASPQQVTDKAQQIQRQGAAVIPGTEIALPRMDLPSFPESVSGLTLGSVAVIGSLGLLALVLVLRRD